MLFVLRYRNGEPEPLDLELVRQVLAPYTVEADEDLTEGVRIRTSDGHEVELDINEVCVAVSRFPPGQFFEILARLVDALGAGVTLADRPAVLRAEDDRPHLPDEPWRDEAVVVEMTGPALEDFVNGS
ncbi:MULTISPECIES: hypothetical protein [unclassified Streptomyces]|uniref:hypothetical protein n=1 Tax=unclassified Streptomyces TaxID=2593676 RepID=UPI003808666C